MVDPRHQSLFFVEFPQMLLEYAFQCNKVGHNEYWACPRCFCAFCRFCEKIGYKMHVCCPGCRLPMLYEISDVRNRMSAFTSFDQYWRDDMEKMNLRISPRSTINEVMGKLCLDERFNDAVFRDKRHLLALLESRTNVEKYFDTHWDNYAGRIAATDDFSIVLTTEKRKSAWKQFINEPRFQPCEQRQHVGPLGFPFPRTPCEIIYEFSKCGEEGCDSFVYDGCLWCGGNLCLTHFFAEVSVGRCSACHAWSGASSLIDNNNVLIWKHNISGEVRVSHVIPAMPEYSKILLGDGNWIFRNVYNRLSPLLERDLRSQGCFFRVLRIALWYLNGEFDSRGPSFDETWCWTTTLTPQRLRSVRLFYNMLCAEMCPPLNEYEFMDLVADVMFVCVSASIRYCLMV